MNERIKELIKESTEFKRIDLGDSGYREQFVFNKEKFAELIVQECINISEAHAKDLESQMGDPQLKEYEDGIVNGIYEATAAIREHFGVEE